MKYAIATGGALVTNPSEDCREARDTVLGLPERKVKCLYSGKIENPILKKELGYSLFELTYNKALFLLSYADNDLTEAKKSALTMLDSESKRIRDSGFVSQVIGIWTGPSSKQDILKASPLGTSAKEAASAGKGEEVRAYKVFNGTFIDLTNDQIVAIDDEINSDRGFIQKCYNREQVIYNLIESATTVEEVDYIYQSEIISGWPQYGEEL